MREKLKFAPHKIDGLMPSTAMVVATTRGKKLARNIRKIAGGSPMPNQSMARGIQASGEMGLQKLNQRIDQRTDGWHHPQGDTQGDTQCCGQIKADGDPV
jgi:hypothetical protein